MRRLMLVLLMCSALSSVVAGPFEDGAAAYERGDYATALRLMRPMAEQSNASAQLKLGLMYGLGQGVPQDYTESVKWYGKAAAQGNASAQFNLGIRYDNGQGVPQDYAMAMKWYRKAADQGYAPAQASLGTMYGLGQGIPQSYNESLKWYRKAAEQGYMPSPRPASVLCTKTDEACRGTMPSRRSGIGSLPIKARLPANTTSRPCITTAKVFHRIMCRRTSG